MNTFLTVVLPIVVGTACAVLGYLAAQRRAGSEIRRLRDAQIRLEVDLRVVGEQRDQALSQSEKLREECDEARRAQRGSESSMAEQITRLNTASERIGRLEAELESAREHHQRLIGEAEKLRSSLGVSTQKLQDLESALATADKEKAVLEAASEELKRSVGDHAAELAKLRTERTELEKRQAEVAAAQKELEQLREKHDRLQSEQVEATVARMLETSQEKLTAVADEKLGTTAKAVSDKLQELGLHLREADTRWTSAEARLGEQIRNLAAENVRSRTQTEALVKALRKPQVRGQWGELQLKRAVELANMREHCDFDTQVTVADEAGARRPDMVVNLTNGRRIVVDAKVSLDAFMNAVEAGDEAEHERFMDEHAAQIRKHVDELAAKEYFVTVSGSPDFVLMFLPNESLLQAALDRSPDLYEHALGKRIIIATPTVLIPILRTIALSWDEKAMWENTEKIHELGREIYDRLVKVGEHLRKLKGSLEKSVEYYNATIGSLESRVLPTARRFRELGIRPAKQLFDLVPVDQQPRSPVAPELVRSALTADGQDAARS